MKPLITSAVAAVIVAGALAPAAAQAPAPGGPFGNDRGGVPMSRWSAWLGCWTPNELRPPTRDIRLCVVPNSERTGVRLVTFAGEQIVSEETVVADGSRRTVTERGCTGARTARFATAGERLYTTSELRCDGQAATPATPGALGTTATAAAPTAMISTLTTPNRWLDIQVTGAVGRQSVRTAHYTRSMDQPPAAIAGQLADLSARHGVTITPITVEDITEAATLVPSPAVELWLAEVEPRVDINKRTLTQLADAQVSEPVIDLLVGLAYPQRFRVQRMAPPDLAAAGYIGPMYPTPYVGGFYGPWSRYGGFDFPYSPFGLMAFEYGAFGALYPYYPVYTGYPAFGIGSPSGGGVVPEQPSGRGRVVNGAGYTRVEPIPQATSSNSGGSRSGSSDGGPISFSGSSGDSGASPGGYSSGGSGGGGQTAVPR